MPCDQENDALKKSPQQAGERSQLLLSLAKQHAEEIGTPYRESFQDWLSKMNALTPGRAGKNAAGDFRAYLGGWSEGWVIFPDTLRQRGNSYLAREAA